MARDVKDIKFSNEKPPVWDRLVAKFNVEWSNTIVAYDDTIHFSEEMRDEPFPRDLVVHEAVHLRQQHLEGMTPAAWWDKYLSDDAFRAAQEIEAYQIQYRFFKSKEKDRNEVARFLNFIALDLSSTRYGSLLTYPAALVVIRNGS